MTVSNETNHSADISWTGSGATYYQIRYYENGTTNYYYRISETSPITIYALLPSADYKCEIRTKDGGSLTPFTDVQSFTTLAGSQVVATDLAVFNVTSNSADVSWTGSGASYYQVRYYVQETTDYNYKVSTTSPITLNSLSPSTDYYCEIRTNDGGVLTPWEDRQSFITLSGEKYIASIDNTKSEKNMFDLIAYPNPFNNEATIELKSTGNEQVHLIIMDITGRIIESLQIKANEPLHIGKNLVPGIYLIQAINSKGERAVFKLIKSL